VTVAHRLSTIKNSEQIAVVSQGQVQEIGTHNDLLLNRGLYYSLNATQVSSTQ
jgi:ABC-type multidrug transport system fused ATPase/permease subunit